ncbi:MULTISPECIES: hypothetical protein [unclassified Pseudomonas]|uniref:hypothetical protein n=1 Tax=unclassified Pseudomonas TaxID=196821 RepID=UPI002AC8FFD8|nr:MULTISPECIES: hypothetical protein [unclassified Pseudomonas]MEB0040450.1 hypothetical protein [Pseudomonas sp. MH10]MEB0078801.1 hypothetical protein [Pseudomonas sp. MH10out]MEB0089706.1 hypothetical protein [Pseudomonas sp. CCI4.2]MEB0103573.1 hypothetical protein [Pseudomonas sp. CCI3.2]MEB0121296.1 hypothetical protein [Pseudomonas sp. CCI1.2]
MTTPVHTPAPEAVAEPGTEIVAGKKAAIIPDFKFSFKPADFAPVKTLEEPYYKKSGKASHNKIPGAAPHGTRKSMGKR